MNAFYQSREIVFNALESEIFSLKPRKYAGNTSENFLMKTFKLYIVCIEPSQSLKVI